MPVRRTLSLKREVLQELTDGDLQVIGGAGPDTKETLYSCLAFQSCRIVNCGALETAICPV
ncbi:MAG TPA: hypothetical protein VFQ85_03785 [Mycobacteriales bacterium]|nr:hypothetical protein [Mycobacteriales bacterium]